ncbi:glycosyltransferase [Candidatus Pelagibacter communis]|uniref:glycosyltransferase n=1 Tax=Candidatus Pelagibacter TaxID=198251 RepID=UPI00094CCED2|nr:glycosyltransferase [Candidatus Pelagibacter ubique]
MSNELSIISPALNEEKNIEPLTLKIIEHTKKTKFEIIFVDDNSTDQSKKILLNLSKKYKFFNPILRKKKRDLTQSCFDGINKSKYKNILILDADMQHDPKYIPQMLKEFNKGQDIVIGARKLTSGKNKGLSETRRFASIFLIFFFKIFNIQTKDPMSGFFLFKKDIYLKNKKRFFGKGFKILADILINSKTKLKAKDVPINFNRRYESESKMNTKILLILINFYIISLIKKFLTY